MNEHRMQGERRSLAAGLHIPERRTGFDRRRRHAVLGQLRDDPKLLAVLLVMFVLMSLADGGLTAYELGAGLASEGNPVLSTLLSAHPAAAAAFKIALTTLVAGAIWHGRQYRKILAVSIFSLLLYAALLAYHVGSLHGIGAI